MQRSGASSTDATGARSALVLLLGGARSGKSALAVRWARSHDGPVVLVATGWAGDDEMQQRIARHRAERPPAWQTIEQPREVAAAVRDADRSAFVVVDCLTLWVANMLDASESDILAQTDALVSTARTRNAPTVVISNEVGSGIVPTEPESRRYRDLLGLVNARMAQAADSSMLLVAGRVLPLQAAPSQPTEVV